MRCARTAFAVDHKHRIDQIIGRYAMFAYETARELVAAIAPHSTLRKMTKNIHGI
jgi:hypothetical protein